MDRNASVNSANRKCVQSKLDDACEMFEEISKEASTVLKDHDKVSQEISDNVRPNNERETS